MILADVMKNNQTDISKSYEESLKKEYGCEPFGDWDLIPKRKRNTFFQHVCLPKTYQVEDAPLIETQVHIKPHLKAIRLGLIRTKAWWHFFCVKEPP